MSTKSSKNELQEYCTMNRWNYPVYELLSTNPDFSVRVRITRDDRSEVIAVASDAKKKGAEKEAARLALLKLQGKADIEPETCSANVMDTVPGDNGITPVTCKDGIPEIPNNSSLLGSQKNYRSKLHEYCQHHGLKIKFSSETYDTFDAPRFSAMLSVDSKTVSGGGSSKKEANEEAARKMWFILEQENSFPSTNSKIPVPTLIQTEPFTIGIQPPNSNVIMLDVNDPKAEAELLQYYNQNNLLIPSKLDTAQFIPLTHQNISNQLINKDYTGDLEQLLDDTDLEISYTSIPTEGMITESVYLFINLSRKGHLMPTYTGHGYGATEMDARNAAARNLMQLLPDDFGS